MQQVPQLRQPRYLIQEVNMKLISEFVENDIEFLITEDKKTGQKNYGISNAYNGKGTWKI